MSNHECFSRATEIEFSKTEARNGNTQESELMASIPQVQLITSSMLNDAQEVVEWAQNFISKPHPCLGREGPICPFVWPSIQKNAFFMTFHYEVDVNNEVIIYLMRCYRDFFLRCFTTSTPERLYNSLLVVFPNIPEEDTPVVDEVARELKTGFVQSGLMIGEFHPRSSIAAARNPEFHPMVAPFPMLAIRNMALHDILFLHQKKIWFDEFNARFGQLYQENKVSNKDGLADLYNATKERYSV
jgi:heptaprenyl diphosphate synthase